VKLDLQEIDMITFPATDRQKAAQRFFDNIANPDSAKAKAFLESDFSAGVIERNGATRLIEIFGMIHADNPNLKLTAVREDDSHIQLAATAEGGATIKFLIKFLEDQIDGLEIEAN
ncbi:MAG: hypothetical protein KDK48_06020, partial [Chlamydiia bacterium]|nr:hypothetical protein [Chlamydiia bacterium]